MDILHTKRLILRPFKSTDLDDFYAYASVPGVGEAAGWPHHAHKAITKEVLKAFISGKDVYAIEHKADQKVIGSLGLHQRQKDAATDHLKHREIGYVLSKAYWSQGLMTEAVLRVIDYCFSTLELDLLWCSHFKVNARSKRVVEKTGFVFYKNDIHDSKLLNKRFNSLTYKLTKEAYFNTLKLQT